MLTGEDLVIQLFFWTSAFLAVVEAVKAAGWRIRAFCGLAAVLFLVGLGWGLLKEIYPPLTGWVTSVATNPQSWFLLFVIFLVLVSVTGRAKHRSPQGIAPDIAALDAALQGLFGRVGAIEQLPAPPAAGDHDNLRTTVHSWMRDDLARFQKSEESMDAVMERLAALEKSVVTPNQHPQTARDILLLMHFIIYQSTLLMLDDLIDSALAGMGDGPLQLGAEFAPKSNEAKEFIALVRRKLDPGSWRRQHFEEAMRNSENGAEYELEKTPVELRPASVDALALRKWMISYSQFINAVAFLKRERKEAEENLRNQRHSLIERYSEMNK